MIERGVVDEARAALAGPISRTASTIHGLRDFAELPLDEAVETYNRRGSGATPGCTSASGCGGIPGVVIIDANRPATEVADEIVELARARERLPGDGAARLGRPSGSARSSGAPTASSRSPATAPSWTWNPDGSQAEMSGNWSIAARWLAERTGAEVVRLRVGEREVVARMLGGDEVEQDLGAVRVGGPESVGGYDVVPVDVGNPHAVVVGDPDDLPTIGPALETHPRFPRTNVQVARVDAPGEVTARVWERGVGETAASGTSAVAVAAATHGDGEVVVHFPGGDLHVRIERGRAYLRGPAAPLDEVAHDSARRSPSRAIP